MATLYDALPVEDDLKARFHEARDAVNQFLDSDTFINLNGQQVVRRRVFEVFLYGGLAHAGPETEFTKYQCNWGRRRISNGMYSRSRRSEHTTDGMDRAIRGS